MEALRAVVLALVFTVGASVTLALILGLLGVSGVISWVRCDNCGHLGIASSKAGLRSCARCRHGSLLHR